MHCQQVTCAQRHDFINKRCLPFVFRAMCTLVSWKRFSCNKRLFCNERLLALSKEVYSMKRRFLKIQKNKTSEFLWNVFLVYWLQLVPRSSYCCGWICYLIYIKYILYKRQTEAHTRLIFMTSIHIF